MVYITISKTHSPPPDCCIDMLFSQNPRSLRRLATDHASLHNEPLPPNYLFDPKVDPSSDLTKLDILLSGPTSTPYETGVFRLHLSIPPTYPTDPPKAFFRTKIFHPNVDTESGAVCVETLKRDWKSSLRLRDVLVTISCLLVVPNASSALNAEAGMLLEQEDGGWEAFTRRARLMTRLQAAVPKDMKELVMDAQRRGDDVNPNGVEANRKEKQDLERKDSGQEEQASTTRPRRSRRVRDVSSAAEDVHVRQTRSHSKRQNITSPVLPPSPEKQPPLPPSTASRPFVTQSGADDVFGGISQSRPPRRAIPRLPSGDAQGPGSDTEDENQENNSAFPPIATRKPTFHPSPARIGPAVPLGELSLVDHSDTDHDEDNHEQDTTSDDSIEAEYPPSPRKSPRKKSASEYPPSPKKESPQKRSHVMHGLQAGLSGLSGPSSFADIFAPRPSRPDFVRAESSRTAAEGIGRGKSVFFTPVEQILQPGHPSQTPDMLMGEEEGESEFEVSFEFLRQSERKKRVATMGGGGALLSSPPRRRKMPAANRISLMRSSTVEENGYGADPFAGSTLLASRPGAIRAGVKKPSPPLWMAKKTSSTKTKDESKAEQMEKRLWEMCGGDVDKWNRGEFGDYFKIKAARW